MRPGDNPIQVAANASSFAVLVNFLSDDGGNLAFDFHGDPPASRTATATPLARGG